MEKCICSQREKRCPWGQMLSGTSATKAAAHLIFRCCTRNDLETGARATLLFRHSGGHEPRGAWILGRGPGLLVWRCSTEQIFLRLGRECALGTRTG